MELAQAGDKAALRKCFARDCSIIKNFLRKFNYLNLIDVDDLCQGSFIGHSQFKCYFINQIALFVIDV